MDIMVTISEIPSGFSNNGEGVRFLREGKCYDLPLKISAHVYSLYSDSFSV